MQFLVEFLKLCAKFLFQTAATFCHVFFDDHVNFSMIKLKTFDIFSVFFQMVTKLAKILEKKEKK